MNPNELIPCQGQGAKRTGILLDIWNLSFDFPAPCDCYDDIVVPIGAVAAIGKGLANTILRKFPSWFKGWRKAKFLPEIAQRTTKVNKWQSKLDAVTTRVNELSGNVRREYNLMIKSQEEYNLCVRFNGVANCTLALTALQNITKKYDEAVRLLDKVVNGTPTTNGIEGLEYCKGKTAYYTGKLKELTDVTDSIDDSVAWADRADAILSTIYPDYLAQILEFAGNFIGLFSFIEKHQCTDPDMLNQETCRCTECSGLQLCEAWKNDTSQGVWNWMPQAPGISVQDEDNVCFDCCGGSILKVKSGGILGDSYCECECPDGMIKRPCQIEPAGYGCSPENAHSGRNCVDICYENRFDSQPSGLCAAAITPPGMIWSDVKCAFIREGFCCLGASKYSDPDLTPEICQDCSTPDSLCGRWIDGPCQCEQG